MEDFGAKRAGGTRVESPASREGGGAGGTATDAKLIPELFAHLEVTEPAGPGKPEPDATDWHPNWVTSASLLGAILAGSGCIVLCALGFSTLVNHSFVLCLPLFGASAVCGWV